MSTTLGAARYYRLNHRRGARENRPVHYAFSTAEVALKRQTSCVPGSRRGPHFDFYFDERRPPWLPNKVYSTVEAPSTIDSMVPAMQQETGTRFASAPLLSATLTTLTQKLISGIVVGPAAVNGRPCQHWHFGLLA